MQNRIQKTAIALLAITVTLLVSGNVLIADDRETGDVITAADLAFIKAGSTGTATGVVTDRRAPSAGLITPADYAFVAQEYAASSGTLWAQAAPETVGIITAADYEFLTKGRVGDVFSAYSDFADSLAGRLAK